MVRVITQETYDEVVQENMTDLDMSPEEAVDEAVAQFHAQGVDLSNIIKDLVLQDSKDHLVSTAITNLKTLVALEDPNGEELMKELKLLKSECEKDLARRVRAGKEGAYPILITLLDRSIRKECNNLSVLVLETLTALMDTQPDLLDDSGVVAMKSILEQSQPNKEVVLNTLKWISVCCLKHEMNRQAIFKADIVGYLKKYLEDKPSPKVLAEILQVLRRLCLDDDIRHEIGKAHEHSRDIAAQTLTTLTGLLKESATLQPVLVSQLMLTTATVLVRHELCRAAADDGATGAMLDICTRHYDNVEVVMQAFKLIKALAGHDDVKRELMKSGIAPITVSLLNRHMANSTAVSLALGCIAMLALREPSHSREFIDNGAADAIVDAMKVHSTVAGVQKNAAWAIRNMVARCRDLNTKFTCLGVEECLNEAYVRFEKEFGFDVKSALRDLECEVKLEEQWTGKGVQMEH